MNYVVIYCIIHLFPDPSHVIGLYPDLLPKEYRKQLEYPDTLPDLNGSELEKGLLSLIEYLTQKRNEVVKDVNPEVVTSAIVEGRTTIKSKRQLWQIIDTTLLKCYLIVCIDNNTVLHFKIPLSIVTVWTIVISLGKYELLNILYYF